MMSGFCPAFFSAEGKPIATSESDDSTTFTPGCCWRYAVIAEATVGVPMSLAETLIVPSLQVGHRLLYSFWKESTTVVMVGNVGTPTDSVLALVPHLLIAHSAWSLPAPTLASLPS